jgi:hypothetical protein
MGTVLMRAPLTVLLSLAHALLDGQQASPGRQRHLALAAEAEAVSLVISAITARGRRAKERKDFILTGLSLARLGCRLVEEREG